MRALFKSSIILALLAVSVYLYWSQSQDFFAPPKPKALIAPVDPAAKAEEELDYLVAKRIGSLREWQAFLTAHGSGFYAQSARAEVERLLHAERTPGPVAAEVSNSASPSVTAAIGAERPAEPSAGLQVVTPTQDEICKRDEERLVRLSPSSDEVARFANELGCERLRPQLLGLMETLGSLAPAPAAAEVSNSVSPDAKPGRSLLRTTVLPMRVGERQLDWPVCSGRKRALVSRGERIFRQAGLWRRRPSRGCNRSVTVAPPSSGETERPWAEARAAISYDRVRAVFRGDIGSPRSPSRRRARAHAQARSAGRALASPCHRKSPRPARRTASRAPREGCRSSYRRPASC